jgi:hypothetical protein
MFCLFLVVFACDYLITSVKMDSFLLFYFFFQTKRFSGTKIKVQKCRNISFEFIYNGLIINTAFYLRY